MSISIIVVSHSQKLAEGICELAGQMAADVNLVPLGGTEDGDLGTSAPRIQAALETALADADASALVLLDLGSAAMNTELALELLTDEQRGRVAVAQAPVVEGAVVAAVSVSGGATLEAAQAEAEAVARIEKLS